ncbi:hypothetical protein ABVT39_022787 [Epinephelus coioides]
MYKTWAILNKSTNYILTANCTCMAGAVWLLPDGRAAQLREDHSPPQEGWTCWGGLLFEMDLWDILEVYRTPASAALDSAQHRHRPRQHCDSYNILIILTGLLTKSCVLHTV